MDSTRAGTTAKTFTSTFSITFTYKCSTSDSTIYGIPNADTQHNRLEYFRPNEIHATHNPTGTAIFEYNWPYEHRTFYKNTDSTSYCGIKNLELREDNTCATLASKPLTNTANFDMIPWSASQVLNKDARNTKFKLNRNPDALWSYTKCLYMDNAHTISRTITFTLQVVCGDNTAQKGGYVVNHPADMITA